MQPHPPPPHGSSSAVGVTRESLPKTGQRCVSARGVRDTHHATAHRLMLCHAIVLDVSLSECDSGAGAVGGHKMRGAKLRKHHRRQRCTGDGGHTSSSVLRGTAERSADWVAREAAGRGKPSNSHTWPAAQLQDRCGWGDRAQVRVCATDRGCTQPARLPVDAGRPGKTARQGMAARPHQAARLVGVRLAGQ